MQHIDQPRGPGTAYRFKMRTPQVLIGHTDPQTGKPFGRWIIRTLGGERHLPTAKRLRDIRLAEVRALEADAKAGADLSGRFSLYRAEAWAEALRVQTRDGGPAPYQPDVRELIYDEIDRAPRVQRKAFTKLALSGTLSIADAVDRYLHDRREGNGLGYETLKTTTISDVWVAVRYLAKFMEAEPDALFLDDVTPGMATEFRGDFLPAQTTPRAPEGLSLKTTEKYCSMLRGLWGWAIEHRKVPSEVNPFDKPKGVRRVKPKRSAQRRPYTADEAGKVMVAFPLGNRLGDIFRLALVSGVRADEIAKVTVENTTEDGSFYTITGGKTENAQRPIPVPEVAREIVKRRRQQAKEAGQERLFWEYPLRPSTGKASSLSQEFTRARRKVLGTGTDGELSFHSLRHTWRTKARQAGVPAGDANDLGGWAGERTSSSVYDHGLLLEDLAERQQQVAERLHRDGYLEGWQCCLAP